MIEAKNVSMEYCIKKNKKKLALDDVSFCIESGETVGVIGLNGAGKSSLIKLLTGIMNPTNGEITIMGQNPFIKRKKICKNYGVMFGQRSQLWWDLPVKDSFYVNGGIYGLSKRQVYNKLHFFTEWFHIDYLDVPVRKLSLGRRVICDILLSMLHEPQILFLDEATIALDIINRKKVLEMMDKINKELNTTLIITSHQLDDIESVCKRILFLNKGKLSYDGLLKDFLKGSFVQKVIAVHTLEIENIKGEIEKLIRESQIFIMCKGSEMDLFLEYDDKMFGQIIKFLSMSKYVDSFSIREITLEERILLMEGIV